MSKIDEKYIKALDLFTVALEEIVETLKLQQKKSDSVNEMLNNIPQDNLQQVVTDLKKITESGFKDLKNDNKTILKKIESIKQQKESGMFGSVEDPKNKNKIVDGIKVVMLIAGGVLAMGLAFKIIGKVDFASVIALSSAILMMSIAYSKIADKKLKYLDILRIASILPIMAISLVASSFILSQTSTISFAQGLSLILIAGALGLASYLLLKSINKLDTKSLIFVPLLAVILPLIALGLVLSSRVLKGIQVLDPMQIIAVGLVGLALGIATFAISLALKNLKTVTWKEMLMLPLMLPLIALGLVLSSVILKGFSPIVNPVQLLIGSAVIGLSMLFFAPTVLLLGKMKFKDVLQGLLVIPLLAYAIVLAANQFNELPNNMRSPEWKWSLSVGLAMISFVPAILLLGKMKFKDVLQGMIIMPLLAYAIVIVANKFTELPNSMRYPDFKWTIGAGLTILVFGLLVFGIGYLASKYKNEFIAGLLAIVGVAGAIWAVDMAISKGDYTKYPKINWLLGAGLSILAFGLLVFGIGYVYTKYKNEFLNGLLGIVAIAGVIYFVDDLISKGEYTKHPEIDWVLGTGLALGIFGLVAIGIGYLSKGPQLALGLLGIVGVAAAILAVDFLIKNGDYSKYPSINWALGTSLSLVTFGLGAIVLGFALVSGVGAIALAAGLVGILAIAGSMLAVDAIFNAGGNFSKYPTYEWSIGVGGSLLAFSLAAMLAVGAGVATLIGSLFTGGEDPLVRVAKSMVGISKELQLGKWDGNYPKQDWALGVGTALTLFAGATVVAGGVGLMTAITSFFTGDVDPLLKLVRSMVYISWQIQDGKWDGNYPKQDWSLGVGTAMTLFAGATVVAGGVGLAKSILSFFTGDSDPLLSLVKSMVAVSKELQFGKWDGNYPKHDWSIGVGTAMTLFAGITIVSGGVSLSKSILSFFTGDSDPLLSLVKSMVAVSKELQFGKWDGNYPKHDWSIGVGAAITLFAGVSLAKSILSFFTGDSDPLLSLVKSMVAVSKELQLGKWDGNYPKHEWSIGVGGAITLFAGATVIAGGASLAKSILSFFKGDSDPLLSLAKSMVDVSKQLQGGKWTNYPKIGWADGVAAIVKVGESIDDFKSLDLSVRDVEEFSKSIKFIVSAIEQLKNVSANESILTSMIIVRKTLQELSGGVDDFMTEPGMIFGRNKRSMSDFSTFSNSLLYIVSAIQILSTLKPMPNGILTGFVEFMSNLKNLPEIPSLDTKSETINKLATSFATLANSLGLVNTNLKEFTSSYKELSLLNDSKFNDINANSTLKIVHQSTDKQINVLSKMKSMSDNLAISPESKNVSEESKISESEYQKQFYSDIADIKSLLYEFKDTIEKPTQSGSFYN